MPVNLMQLHTHVFFTSLALNMKLIAVPHIVPVRVGAIFILITKLNFNVAHYMMMMI